MTRCRRHRDACGCRDSRSQRAVGPEPCRAHHRRGTRAAGGRARQQRAAGNHPLLSADPPPERLHFINTVLYAASIGLIAMGLWGDALVTAGVGHLGEIRALAAEQMALARAALIVARYPPAVRNPRFRRGFHRIGHHGFKWGSRCRVDCRCDRGFSPVSFLLRSQARRPYRADLPCRSCCAGQVRGCQRRPGRPAWFVAGMGPATASHRFTVGGARPARVISRPTSVAMASQAPDS